jgi:hypothetical protein
MKLVFHVWKEKWLPDWSDRLYQVFHFYSPEGSGLPSYIRVHGFGVVILSVEFAVFFYKDQI